MGAPDLYQDTKTEEQSKTAESSAVPSEQADTQPAEDPKQADSVEG